MRNSSLERIYPRQGEQEQSIAGHDTLQLHLERYHFAGRYLVAGAVADIACGAGYGSYLLATEYGGAITRITAVDNNEEAITYAKKNYPHPLIDFVQEDAFHFQPASPFQTIICLETIEHLAEPEKFVQQLCLHLAAGGRFIASAPVTPSMDANPYHLQDFTTTTFRKLFLQAGLTEVNAMIQTQSFHPFRLRGKENGREGGIRKGLLKYYLTHPGKLWLRIASTFRNGFTNKYLVVVFEKK